MARRNSLLMILLLLLPVIHVVQAQGGAVLIQTDSFSLADGETVQDANVSATLVLHEGMGASANVSILLLVESMEGEVVSNRTQQVPELSAHETLNLTVTFVGLPYGHSVLNATLVGEVGAENTTHATTVSVSVQRLRPLAVSLGGTGSVVAEGVDVNGDATGNLTLRDGDRVAIAFPVINNGDVNWTGGATLDLVNGEQHETVVVSNLSVLAAASTVVEVAPAMMIGEGLVNWWVNLTGELGAEPGTHALNGSWTVDPPPLPLLNGEMSSDAGSVQAGEVMTISLYVWNNGSVAFQGGLACSNVDGELFNSSSLNLAPSASQNWSFTTSAKPMVVSCAPYSGRLDTSSAMPATLSIDMPSAVFESAGSSVPSLAGGPWHKGDVVSANMLLRNTGSLDGRVRLTLTAGATQSHGEWVALDEGAAGEIFASLQFLNDGQQTLSWSLESDDGLVVGEASGNLTVTVRPQQSISVAIVDVEETSEDGVQFAVHLDLDEGVERTVLLQVGYEAGGASVFLQENNLQLQGGLHVFTFAFGEVDADQIVAQVAPVNWLVGPGPLATSASLPDSNTQFWVEFGATTDPIRPVQGDETQIDLTFQQSGPFLDAQGDLWVTDAYGTRLAKVTSPSWNGGSQATLTVNIVWPKGSNVGLQATWQIDGQLVSSEATYVSGEVVVESSNDLPIGAMVLGLALGGAAVLLLRLQGQRGSASTKRPSSAAASTAPPTKVASNEKREVSCPECDRRLRVPVSYAGTVGCPDCSHKFAVEAQAAPAPSSTSTPDPDDDDEVVEVQEEAEPTPAEKVEVGCPECAQTLRIPGTYAGSVRCPACTHVFKSHEGVR